MVLNLNLTIILDFILFVLTTVFAFNQLNFSSIAIFLGLWLLFSSLVLFQLGPLIAAGSSGLCRGRFGFSSLQRWFLGIKAGGRIGSAGVVVRRGVDLALLASL